MSSRKKSTCSTSTRGRTVDPPDEDDLGKAIDMLDRRRLQNRISQRNYRNKIKSRLEKLESLLGPEAAAALADEDAAPDSTSTITVRGKSTTTSNRVLDKASRYSNEALDGADLDAPDVSDIQATPSHMKSPIRGRPTLVTSHSSSASASTISSSASDSTVEQATTTAEGSICSIADETYLPLMDDVDANLDSFDWNTLMDNEELLYKAREANMANMGMYSPGYMNPFVSLDPNTPGWAFPTAPSAATPARPTTAADHCSNHNCASTQGSPPHHHHQHFLPAQMTGMIPASPPFSRAHPLHRYASAPAVPQLAGMVPGTPGAAGSVPQPMFFVAVPFSSQNMPALDLQGLYAPAQQQVPPPSAQSMGGEQN
jgi:hypothetical protein